MRTIVGLVILALPLSGCGGSDEASETPAEDVPRVETPAPESIEELQIVQVRVEGNKYLFSPETVQAGHPVRLVFDPNELPGCSKGVTLPAYDITKFIAAEDPTIEFTPEAHGPIAVACTMNMYTGTLLAE